MARRRKKSKARQKREAITSLIGFSTLATFAFVWSETKSTVLAIIAIFVVAGVIMTLKYLISSSIVRRLKKSGIADIDKMGGFEFEHYLSHLFISQGYDATVTKSAGDFGADLILSRNGKKIVVQAKRYTKNVGISAVQECQASVAHYKANEAWVVSNSSYTDAATILARSNGVRLIGREELIDMMVKMNSINKQKAV